jgi:hypothetical protein
VLGVFTTADRAEEFMTDVGEDLFPKRPANFPDARKELRILAYVQCQSSSPDLRTLSRRVIG